MTINFYGLILIKVTQNLNVLLVKTDQIIQPFCVSSLDFFFTCSIVRIIVQSEYSLLPKERLCLLELFTGKRPRPSGKPAGRHGMPRGSTDRVGRPPRDASWGSPTPWGPAESGTPTLLGAHVATRPGTNAWPDSWRPCFKTSSSHPVFPSAATKSFCSRICGRVYGYSL